MDPTQIHYFLTLTRTLSFTRAAEACHVTQPVLTKSIQRLEKELGGPLLLQERAMTQLTALGRAMLPLLTQTHNAAEHAKEHAAAMKRQTASPLRLGFAPGVPAAPFLPLFEQLAAHLPGFELSLANADSAELCDAMLEGTLDAAVVTGEAALPKRLHRWTLFTDQAALLILPGHVVLVAAAGRPCGQRTFSSNSHAHRNGVVPRCHSLQRRQGRQRASTQCRLITASLRFRD